MGKVCAYKDITIEGGCKGTAHATTPQMTAGASQTLYIEGGSEGDTYYWSTTSGSLSSPTGTSVTYTAPATNPNCVNNPTITVTCGGVVIDTLKLAVVAGYTGYLAYRTSILTTPSTCRVSIVSHEYNCLGNDLSSNISCDGCDCLGYDPVTCDCGGGTFFCTPEQVLARCTSLNRCGTQTVDGIPITIKCSGTTDVRTAAAKAAGCCPAALL
jgi:hypothetical protein